MARALTVQNAEINTASITIRTLQVEGRQVTMGVFRQLPVEDIISDELSLRGVGWGHVNYLIEGGNYAYYGHTHIYANGRPIHLVWQRGNELRRCLVPRDLVKPPFIFPNPESDATAEAVERYRKAAEDPNNSQKGWYKDQADRSKEKRTLWLAERAEAWDIHQEMMRWIDARNALVTPLFELPQLFIAV